MEHVHALPQVDFPIGMINAVVHFVSEMAHNWVTADSRNQLSRATVDALLVRLDALNVSSISERVSIVDCTACSLDACKHVERLDALIRQLRERKRELSLAIPYESLLARHRIDNEMCDQLREAVSAANARFDRSISQLVEYRDNLRVASAAAVIQREFAPVLERLAQ